MNYKEQLESPEWQKKRLEILNRDGWTCQECGDKETQLHVHHRYYVNDGRMAWEYPFFALLTLCKNCHAKKKDENTADRWERFINFLEPVAEVTAPFYEAMEVLHMDHNIFLSAKQVHALILDALKDAEEVKRVLAGTEWPVMDGLEVQTT